MGPNEYEYSVTFHSLSRIYKATSPVVDPYYGLLIPTIVKLNPSKSSDALYSNIFVIFKILPLILTLNEFNLSVNLSQNAAILSPSPYA